MIDQTERKPLRPLVVEDECLIAFELCDFLEDLGHQVVVGMAAAPNQALRLIRELGGQIDAVMVDANLGGQSSAPWWRQKCPILSHRAMMRRSWKRSAPPECRSPSPITGVRSIAFYRA